MGIASRKRKPLLKEDAVPSIFSYVPEKKVCQASIDRANLAIHQSQLPRRDRVVSSAVYSTASGGSSAMFESLSTSEEVPCCGSNKNGRITLSDSISD